MRRGAAQRHRIFRAANHVHANLAQPLDLDQMAEVACLSKFHFVRAFQFYCRETPAQFLWRTRLDRAARSLVYRPDFSITDVALDCGFSSSQTFSRAFRRRFAVAPRTLRSSYRPGFACLKQDQSPKAQFQHVPSYSNYPWTPGDVKIETRPTYRIAYVRHLGPYWNADGGIARAYADLEQWARAKGLWSGAAELFGVCPNNSDVTPAAYCVYDAGLAVDRDVCEDEVVSIQTIPAGRFAVLRVEENQIERAWTWLGMIWLPASKWTYALDHCYEVIHFRDGQRDRNDMRTDLCMRLTPN
ncbi:MAG: GyrI-like domain-containing protein [Pseudomonadota bacterium]